MKLMVKIILRLVHFIPVLKVRRFFLRSVGVKMGHNCRFFKADWGTEPYLIELGNHVVVSNGVRFLNHDGGVWVFRSKFPKLDLFGSIKVGNNVCLGLNVIVLPNTTIGDNCIVAAGSVIKGRIPSNSVVFGNPGKVIMPLNIQERLVLMSKFKFETKGMSYGKKKRLLQAFFKSDPSSQANK